MAGRPWRRAITRYAELIQGNPAAPGEWDSVLRALHRHYPYARSNSIKMTPWDFVRSHRSQIAKLVTAKLPSTEYDVEVRAQAVQELEMQLADKFAVRDANGNLTGFQEFGAEEWMKKVSDIALSPVIGVADDGRLVRKRGRGLLAAIRRQERSPASKLVSDKGVWEAPVADKRHHPLAPAGGLAAARTHEARLHEKNRAQQVWDYILHEASREDQEILALYYATYLDDALRTQEMAQSTLRAEMERRAGGAIVEISEEEAEDIWRGFSDIPGLSPDDAFEIVDPETQITHWFRPRQGLEASARPTDEVWEIHQMLARSEGMKESVAEMKALLERLEKTIIRVNERAGGAAKLALRQGGWAQKHILTAFPSYDDAALGRAERRMKRAVEGKGLRDYAEANPRRREPSSRSSRRLSSRSQRKARPSRRSSRRSSRR